MAALRETFLAHSKSNAGPAHPLREHLQSVAELAADFARPWGPNEARLAGLLHDLGKYGDLFQERLKNPRQVTGVDHWTMGAWAAAIGCYPGKAWAASLAAAGHHLGLPPLEEHTFANFNPEKYAHEQRRLSEGNLDRLLARLKQDGIALPPVDGFAGEITGAMNRKAPAATMADIRMLFSALVDADYLDTEAHFRRGQDGVKRRRPPGPALNPAWAAKILDTYIKDLAAGSTSSPEINRLRADLLAACRRAAKSPPGQFTLSAPTGSGKTLAMLAFALEHAAAHNLRRVVMVIPYLTIIDQTARVYREVFQPHLPAKVPVEHYVLEHHSMAGTRQGPLDQGIEGPAQLRRRELAENWDAPIIVTTSVQMLESLFSYRPGACRKLHRLAGSVILFDEVQTLPSHLAGVTLATLARLAGHFGSSVVFATATQPAFGALSPKVEALGGQSWRPREIAPPELGLFKRVKRVEVAWPDEGERLSLAQVAEELAQDDNRRSLCVVNLKRHGLAVLRELEDLGASGLCHLSTSLCPAHREAVLEQVRRRLADPAQPPVRLVSTQCVEAGVDLDFPVVYRAWGPLTAIAQAAGRCNRNGNLDFGRVRVFHLQEVDPDTGRPRPLYPDDAYKQAAGVAKSVIKGLAPGRRDINDPGLFEKFYEQLYSARGEAKLKSEGLDSAVSRFHFEDTAKLYRLIEKDAINILVPYDREAYDQLADQARQEGLTRDWIARARPHTVGVFRHRSDSALLTALEPIPLLGRQAKYQGDMSGDWFICPDDGMYDPVVGFDSEAVPGLLSV